MDVDREAITADWTKRNFTSDLWSDPPGRYWRNYVHETDELLLLVQGEIELEMEGKVLRPAAGEEIFIPARVVHSVRNCGKIRNYWLYGYRIKTVS